MTNLNANYTLLQVIDPLTIFDDETYACMASQVSPAVLARLRELPEKERQDALAYLERIAGGLRLRGLNVQARVVTARRHASAVLDFANENQIDLIALTTRGRSGLARLLFGSVADKIVRSADTPVLIKLPREH